MNAGAGLEHVRFVVVEPGSTDMASRYGGRLEYFDTSRPKEL